MSIARYDVALVDGDLPADGGFITSRTKLAAQRIEQRLNLWLAEWFFDESKGVPWAAWMAAAGAPLATAQAHIRRLVEQVPDVTRVTSAVATLDKKTRRVTVTVEGFVLDDAFTVFTSAGTTATNVYADPAALLAPAPIWIPT